MDNQQNIKHEETDDEAIASIRGNEISRMARKWAKDVAGESKPSTRLSYSECVERLPEGYKLAHLPVGSVVPIGPDGSIIEGDAYHGFFAEDALDICLRHAAGRSTKVNYYG